MDNRFVILIGSYNNEKWVTQNIESVLKQTHTNFKIVYYNAASTDKTLNLANSYALKDKRVTLMSTAERHLKTWFFHNFTNVEPIYDNDIICVLDGDDFLSSEDVLNYLNEVYNQSGCWMTYGGMICWEGGDKTKKAFPQNSLPPQNVFDQKLYRQDMWRYSHMRTCRGFLWKRLMTEDFMSTHDGKYITLDDLCTVYPMLEMCPANKIFRIEEPIYIWNASEIRGCTENKTNNIGQIYETEIRNRPKRSELTIISPLLAGGLGNQMFEVAAAASMAKDNNALVVINPTEHILPNQGRNINTYLDNIFRRIITDRNPKLDSTVSVESIYFQPVQLKPNCQLRGHFQSFKYFDHNRNYIRELFAPSKFIVDQIHTKYPNTSNVTAIQVRRGDYIKFPKHHPLLAPDYYSKAVKMADSIAVWVFSDDIQWCKENLHFDCPVEYIKEEDYIEMYLMSFCKNIVISNSTFGWWSAYLQEYPGLIIAPKTWFGPVLITEGFKYEDLIPSTWASI